MISQDRGLTLNVCCGYLSISMLRAVTGNPMRSLLSLKTNQSCVPNLSSNQMFLNVGIVEHLHFNCVSTFRFQFFNFMLVLGAKHTWLWLSSHLGLKYLFFFATPTLLRDVQMVSLIHLVHIVLYVLYMKCTNGPYLCFEHCSLCLSYCLKRQVIWILYFYNCNWLKMIKWCELSGCWFSLDHCFAASLLFVDCIWINCKLGSWAITEQAINSLKRTCLGCVWGRSIDWSQEDTNNLPELPWIISMID